MSEKRLIDANALLDFIHNGQGKEWFNSTSNRLTASDCVNAQPTIDAVEVVRCRDCKHSEPIPPKARNAFYSDRVLVCKNWRGDYDVTHDISVVWMDGYCDEGERKGAADGRTD